MSPDIPPAPPEAEVIRLARLAADMTAHDAAEASRAHDGKGVSAAYWRDVERGRGGRRGKPVPVRASERALAAMARVVGVTPAQLTGAGREDAARVLEEIVRRESVPVLHPNASMFRPLAAVPGKLERGPDDIFPDMSAGMKAQVDRHFRVIEKLVIEAALDGPDTAGSVIFADPHEASRWDRLVETGYGFQPGDGYSLWQLAMLMAVGRVRDDERQAGNRIPRARESLIRR